MTEVENLAGRKITRGEDGRFQTVELDSETASKMARSRVPNKAINTTSSSLLQEAGYENESDAPEHLRILSQIASSKRSGAVPAMRAFLRLTQAWEPASEPAPANLREVKPLFDDGNYDFIKVGPGGVMGGYERIPGDVFADLLRDLRELDEQSEASEAAAAEVDAGVKPRTS